MEIFFNLFKIKYTKMMDLLRSDTNINISSDDTINVFINLEPILNKMATLKVNEYIKTSESTAHFEFISNVLNLASHYKWFFTKNRLHCKVYMYFPSLITKRYKNVEFNPEYRRYYQHRFIENGDNGPLYRLIMQSVPLIQLISEYIEGVYLIDSHQIENSVIPYMITEKQKDGKNRNFIVSTSLYDFQYVNHGYSILVPKQDDSELLTKYNMMPFVYKLNKVLSEDIVHPQFLPFILSIVGSKHRNIYNVKGMGMKNTLRVIQTALSRGLISPGVTNINMLIDIIRPAWKQTILDNYYCTDIKFQYSLLTYTDMHDIESQLIDRFDNIALKKLNDEYLKYYPIDLMQITASPSGKRKIDF